MIIQSATLVKLDDDAYFVIDIQGTVATLRPCEPRYGMCHDVHINMEDEHNQIALVREGKSLASAEIILDSVG